MGRRWASCGYCGSDLRPNLGMQRDATLSCRLTRWSTDSAHATDNVRVQLACSPRVACLLCYALWPQGWLAVTGGRLEVVARPFEAGENVNWREHIVVDPAIRHGSACIAGTRVLVTTILDNLATGLDERQIVDSYPSITRESVRTVVCYAAELAKERTLALPVS